MDSDSPAGLCPQCLILGAFDSSMGADGQSVTRTLDAANAPGGDNDFGRYRILHPLGEGGMGTVYLAEQREPIRRYVALKVVKLGMDTSQVLARFGNERQALAVMDHPNIARIFDAGATPKGRPFFVMEYIDGVPITQYCDNKRMPVGQRLELFLTACSAVQHAHRKGVIHRDLKPSNVLVMEQEGAPVPKVIDFGIAKATDRRAVENTLFTQFGQMVGTPEYASPEQADVTAGDVDETSDAYSLGVVLYELLIGTVPFEGARMRHAGLAEMLRIIREEEAPPLPKKLTTLGAATAEIAARRQTDAASLRRLVDGDLNSIVMKALEKARGRRYSSVTEFAADIQRYVEHRPVLASPPSRLYRVQRFIRRHRPAALAAAAGLAFIVLGGVTVWSFARRGSPPTRPGLADRKTIVLADFANTTGDPGFDEIRQVMAGDLGSSPWLSVLSNARVSQTLGLMVRPADTKLTPEVAAEVCERTASAAVLEGSIAKLADEYELSLRARNCRSGDVLDEEHAATAKKDEVFRALSQMMNRFNAGAGQSLPRVEKAAGMAEGATTPSLEAWRSYSAAMQAEGSRAPSAEVVSLLKRAVEADPNFALAYSALGANQAALGETQLAAINAGKAYELRNRVSEQEYYYVTFWYHRQVTRNLEICRQTLESWTQKYPMDVNVHGLLSAFTAVGTAHYERAVEEGQKAIELDPDFAIGYENLGFAWLYQDRLTEAEAVLHKASERKIDAVPLSLLRYFIAFLRNDKAAMDRETTQRREKLEAQGGFENQEALTLAYQGRLRDADRLSERAESLAAQAHLSERAAMFAGARAAWNALFENRMEAKGSAGAALALHQSGDADYGPAFALALSRDTAKAHEIQVDLAKNYPEDTSVQFSYLPVLRALEALNLRDPAKALEITQAAKLYDLAIPGTAHTNGSLFGALYPVYVRGLAYSQMGRHREAAAEFQEMLDHPGLMRNDPVGPMARLQLARALFASGDRAKSAAAYKELLAIWKDADSDIPLIQEARADAGKL